MNEFNNARPFTPLNSSQRWPICRPPFPLGRRERIFLGKKPLDRERLILWRRRRRERKESFLSGGLEFGPDPVSSPPFHSLCDRDQETGICGLCVLWRNGRKETEERKKEKKERKRKGNVLFLDFFSSKGPFAKDCFARVKTSSNLLAKFDVRAK